MRLINLRLAEGGFSGSTRSSALARLRHLRKRPQFISHESSVEPVRNYLQQVFPDGRFTFLAISSPRHSSAWVLSDNPDRRELREWFHNRLQDKESFAD